MPRHNSNVRNHARTSTQTREQERNRRRKRLDQRRRHPARSVSKSSETQ